MFKSLIETLLSAKAPVAERISEILPSLLGGGVTILAAETGSGKSLVTPPAWADSITDGDESLSHAGLTLFGTHNLIVVCVPRRFLAINNAETVAELAGVTLGQEVGYATGEGHRYTAGVTRVLFCTYGSALASGLAKVVTRMVFDEVHEGAMDVSILRALVHRRMKLGEKVTVLEMSATLNAERQKGYWAPVAPVTAFDIKGGAFTCETASVEHRTLAAEAIEAGLDLPDGFADQVSYLCAYQSVKYVREGRKGALVFRPGIGDCEQTVAYVGEIAEKLGMKNPGAAAITGNLDHSARTRVVRALASGEVRILVGTNVIESGVNLKGADAAVSCGMGKIMKSAPHGEGVWLDEEPLPRWRVIQQVGRVRRFSPGVFTLLGAEMDKRPLETSPEIARLPLVQLVMSCAEYGVRASELDYDCHVDQEKIMAAETRLRRLGIIDSQMRLTPKGEFAKRCPVDPEIDAMLYEAKSMGILHKFIKVAALVYTGGMLANFQSGYKVSSNEEMQKSDWTMALEAFAEGCRRLNAHKDGNMDYLKTALRQDFEEFMDVVYGQHPQGLRDPKRFLLTHLNVHTKKFWEAKEMVRKLESALRSDLASERPQEATSEKIRRCILAGELNSLMVRARYQNQVRTLKGGVYGFGRSSHVSLYGDYILSSGTVRTITTKRGVLSIVVENTSYTEVDVRAVIGENAVIDLSSMNFLRFAE